MGRSESLFRRFARWSKQRSHHLLFGAMLFALTTLLSWWAFFFHATIRREYQTRYRNLLLQTHLTALRLGQQKASKPPSPGVYLWDSRLEIIVLRTSRLLPSDTKVLKPLWLDRAIRPRKEVIAKLKQRFQRRVLMLGGEGAFLALCILIISFMLYQMILLERRSAEELKDFWSRITHEIKTPITGLKAFLETLQQREFSRKELDPLLELAMEQVQRQQKLATNLLRGQQLENSAFAIETTSMECAGLIRDFFARDDIQLTKHRVELSLLPSEKTRVQINPQAIQEILNNLTDNAVKYTKGALLLQVSMREEDEFLVLDVTDNGCGFASSMEEKIFESYRLLRHELANGAQGTGMGLYLSRKLARRMGGDLKASSPGQGQGAVFSLWLKRAPDHQG